MRHQAVTVGDIPSDVMNSDSGTRRNEMLGVGGPVLIGASSTRDFISH